MGLCKMLRGLVKLIKTFVISFKFYRKILNELSSPVSVSKIEEESNSSQSQDGDSPEGASNMTGVQYQQGMLLCVYRPGRGVAGASNMSGVSTSKVWDYVFNDGGRGGGDKTCKQGVGLCVQRQGVWGWR